MCYLLLRFIFNINISIKTIILYHPMMNTQEGLKRLSAAPSRICAGRHREWSTIQKGKISKSTGNC